jgi:hypothetical protein
VTPGSQTQLSSRFKAADQDQAGEIGNSDMASGDIDRDGGTVLIDGEPEAQAFAPCAVMGTRPGIDGTYKGASVEDRKSPSGKVSQNPRG